MNGLVTLADVVEAGHRGALQKAQRGQMDRQQKAQGIYDEAGQRANQVLEAERQAHVAAGGDPAAFRPSDVAMLKASEAFGQTFADKGDWQGYLKNEAAVHPQRMRVRQQALQRFQMEGGPANPAAKAKLLKTFYATIPDGQDIVEVEDVPGGPAPDRGSAPTAAPMAAKPQGLAGAMQQFDAEVLDPMSQLGKDKPIEPIHPGRPGDGRLGAPAGQSRMRVKTSSGETRDVDFDQFMAGAQKMMMSPEAEIKLNYERELARVKAGGQIEVVEARGAQQRQTATQQAAARKDQGLANFDQAMKRDEANREGRKEVAQMRIDGNITAAQVRAASGGGRSGGGGVANSVLKTFPDQDGNAVIVMRNGQNKYMVDDSGKRVKHLDATKLLMRVAGDISKTQTSPQPLQNNVDTARKVLAPQSAGARPAKPSVQSDIDRLVGGNKPGN